MTEIPEHLLKRSKAAKAGKSDDAGGETTPAPASPTPAATESTPAAAAPAADLPNLDPPPEPPKPVPHFVQASLARKRIPMWVLPVIVGLPIWALSFAGTMQQPESDDILLIDAELTYANCASCHGAGGGGGSGYALSDGEVLATFPDVVDQMVHVARGSDAIIGQEYGAERDDGTRVAGGRGQGAMPAQINSLSQVELELVIFHERAILSGEDTSSPAYQEWMEHMRELIETVGLTTTDGAPPIDEEYLNFLLACANPEYTPGATGTGSPDPDNQPCPGPHGEEGAEEAAAGG